jgi:hypothetical protein
MMTNFDIQKMKPLKEYMKKLGMKTEKMREKKKMKTKKRRIGCWSQTTTSSPHTARKGSPCQDIFYGTK